jgi:hypothetical protein
LNSESGERRPSWSRAAHDLALALGKSDRLTLVLGAGASVTSGAPETSLVVSTLRKAASRLGSGEIREQLHAMSQIDRQAAIGPLFLSCIPNIGYRCLAAMARSRRLLILNMNWDPLLRQACSMLDVPCYSFDIKDRGRWGGAEKSPSGRGVIDVHVHGTLDSQLRIGWDETGAFDDDEVALLTRLNGRARIAYLGASLEQDLDVPRVTTKLSNGEHGSLWAFFRGPAKSSTQSINKRISWLNVTGPVIVQDEDVDFDRIAMYLHNLTAGDPWAELKAKQSHLDLPNLDELVLPRPAVLRTWLDAEILLLGGDPQLGKTTIGMLLGHLGDLWSRKRGSFRTFFGANECLAAISSKSGTRGGDIFMLDCPFGEPPHSAADPGFVEALSRWISGKKSRRLVITTGFADWVLSSQGWSHAKLRVAPPNAADWYEEKDLHLYARLLGANEEVINDVGLGVLDCPGRIIDASLGLPVWSDAVSGDRVTQLSAQRKKLLEGDRSLALLCTYARLNEFGGRLLERGVLEELAGNQFEQIPGAQVMLKTYEYEGKRCLRIASEIDRSAIDQWIRDNRDAVALSVSGPAISASVQVNLDAWHLIDRVQAGADLEDSVSLSEYAGPLLDAFPEDRAFELLTKAQLDEWSVSDIAYSLVTRWRHLNPETRRQSLKSLLRDRNSCGTYSVLEACLYVGEAVDAEVWDFLKAALWELAADSTSDWEISLILDGFAWRAAPDLNWSKTWVRRQLSSRPILSGTLPVLTAYHPEGIGPLCIGHAVTKAMLEGVTDAQTSLAERLVRWHFLHQARARAQLSRQHWSDKPFLCRSYHPSITSNDDDHMLWLLRVLAESSHAGWAFHAACFMAGGLNRELGPQALKLALATFENNDADHGIVTAAATYEVASSGRFRESTRAYFGRDVNRDLILDALGGNLVIDGTTLSAPRFLFSGIPETVLRRLAITFPRLESLGMLSSGFEQLTKRVRAIARLQVANGKTPTHGARILVECVESGDLRPLEDAVAAYGADDLSLEALVDHAARVIAELST